MTSGASQKKCRTSERTDYHKPSKRLSIPVAYLCKKKRVKMVNWVKENELQQYAVQQWVSFSFYLFIYLLILFSFLFFSIFSLCAGCGVARIKIAKMPAHNIRLMRRVR